MHVEGGEGKVPASKTFGTELAGGGGDGRTRLGMPLETSSHEDIVLLTPG